MQDLQLSLTHLQKNLHNKLITTDQNICTPYYRFHARAFRADPIRPGHG